MIPIHKNIGVVYDLNTVRTMTSVRVDIFVIYCASTPRYWLLGVFLD